MPCGGAPYGEDNLVFVANDWHSALLPAMLQAHYRDHGQYQYARSVLVLHNAAHQGRGPPSDADLYGVGGDRRSAFDLDDPVGGKHSNILKAGIEAAHRVVCVSRGYAWEVQTPEGGWGLHDVLRHAAGVGKLAGIVNGIDSEEWSPSSDVHLIEKDTNFGYRQYSIDDFKAGKAANKRALQRELGLPEKPDAPLFVFIGRLDNQKGVDLILESAGWLVSQGAQLVMLGSGRPDLEGALRGLEDAHRDAVRCWVGFSVAVAHRLTAAGDILLMPSRFEPCGLNQLYALNYGTVPLVHAVGGLRDTVVPYDPFAEPEGAGNGWLFDRADGGALRDAASHALRTYFDFRESFDALARRGMEGAGERGWEAAAEAYENVLVEAKYVW